MFTAITAEIAYGQDYDFSVIEPFVDINVYANWNEVLKPQSLALLAVAKEAEPQPSGGLESSWRFSIASQVIEPSFKEERSQDVSPVFGVFVVKSRLDSKSLSSSCFLHSIVYSLFSYFPRSKAVVPQTFLKTLIPASPS